MLNIRFNPGPTDFFPISDFNLVRRNFSNRLADRMRGVAHEAGGDLDDWSAGLRPGVL